MTLHFVQALRFSLLCFQLRFVLSVLWIILYRGCVSDDVTFVKAIKDILRNHKKRIKRLEFKISHEFVQSISRFVKWNLNLIEKFKFWNFWECFHPHSVSWYCYQHFLLIGLIPGNLIIMQQRPNFKLFSKLLLISPKSEKLLVKVRGVLTPNIQFSFNKVQISNFTVRNFS